MTRINDNLRRMAWGSLFFIGFMLSPISWWNDAVVNLPIAYLAAQLVALLDKRLFLPAFIGMYWATNLIGLLGMHVSARKLHRKTEQKISLRRFFLISLLYTLLIVALAQFKWIQSPFATALTSSQSSEVKTISCPTGTNGEIQRGRLPKSGP